MARALTGGIEQGDVVYAVGGWIVGRVAPSPTSTIAQPEDAGLDVGRILDAEDVHVEHIIPQKIRSKRAKQEFGDWVTYLGPNAESLHSRYMNRIGNLTLFAGPLNIGASNNPFARKKAAYKESSLKLTKELAKLSGFKFKIVDERSKKLAASAVTLWPVP